MADITVICPWCKKQKKPAADSRFPDVWVEVDVKRDFQYDEVTHTCCPSCFQAQMDELDVIQEEKEWQALLLTRR